MRPGRWPVRNVDPFPPGEGSLGCRATPTVIGLPLPLTPRHTNRTKGDRTARRWDSRRGCTKAAQTSRVQPTTTVATTVVTASGMSAKGGYPDQRSPDAGHRAGRGLRSVPGRWPARWPSQRARVAGRLIPPPPNGPPNSGRRQAVPAWRRPDGDGFEVTARAAIAAQPRRVPAAIPGTVRDTRRPATGDHLARPEGVPPSLTPARCATGSSAHRSVRSTEGRR